MEDDKNAKQTSGPSRRIGCDTAAKLWRGGGVALGSILVLTGARSRWASPARPRFWLTGSGLWGRNTGVRLTALDCQVGWQRRTLSHPPLLHPGFSPGPRPGARVGWTQGAAEDLIGKSKAPQKSQKKRREMPAREREKSTFYSKDDDHG